MRIESPTTVAVVLDDQPDEGPVARLGAAAHHLAHLGLVHRAGEQEARVGLVGPRADEGVTVARLGGAQQQPFGAQRPDGRDRGEELRARGVDPPLARRRATEPEPVVRRHRQQDRVETRHRQHAVDGLAEQATSDRVVRVVAQQRDGGLGLGDALRLLPDPHRRDVAQADVLPGQVGPPLLLADVGLVLPERDEPVVQPVDPAGDLGQLAVRGGHHRRAVGEDVRRQREAAGHHLLHRLGRGLDEVLADVGVVLVGHRVVAVDGDEAVPDSRDQGAVQRVISHTVKAAMRRHTVAPT